MKKVIVIADIENIVRGAGANLLNHYRGIRGRFGWHIMLGSNKIGVIATAQILLIFKYFKLEFSNKFKATAYLIDSQIKSNDSKTNGGWGFVTNFPGAATLEATCWALMALYDECGGHPGHPTIKAGLDWLLRNMVKGENDEGFGMLPDDITSRVYTTCLALKILKMFGKTGTEEYGRALNWLYKVQNVDGGFGTKEGSPSSIVYTSRVIITLIGNEHEGGENLNRAILWLNQHTISLQQLRAHANQEHREIVEFQGRKITFHHMPVQLALTALIMAGDANFATVFEGVNDLVVNNNNHYWMHPNFTNGKQKPLWPIFDTLLVCKALKETSNNWVKLESIGYHGNSLTFNKASGPFSWKRFRQNFILAIWGKCFVLLCALVLLFRMVNLFPQLDKNTYAYVTMVILPLLLGLLAYYLTEMKQDRRVQVQ